MFYNQQYYLTTYLPMNVVCFLGLKYVVCTYFKEHVVYFEWVTNCVYKHKLD